MNKVVAVTATYQRPFEIERLLEALQASEAPLHGVVAVDNGSDADTRERVQQCGLRAEYVDPGENLGCGGGLQRAEEVALQKFPDFTHLWILDDDTVPDIMTLATLLAAMQSTGAGAACPQARDAEGRLNWYPGLRNAARFRVLKRSATPAEFITSDSPEPAEFTWATGVALLVTRAALEKAGLHRRDFWVRGEDLDFSLRITKVTKGIYVPRAHLEHLPPGEGQVVDDFAEQMKHAAMLQNCAFLFARTKHGRPLGRHWPGNVLNHLRRFGFGAFGDIRTAFTQGAILGRPAGSPKGDEFRKRLTEWKAKLAEAAKAPTPERPPIGSER
jgi:rhamnopyranosyl-N-acetylglucosaminyl-diphospho-decaprenol beta-1,3/1,4-galactofuranosyltransferase